MVLVGVYSHSKIIACTLKRKKNEIELLIWHLLSIKIDE